MATATAAILHREIHWVCPNCAQTAITHGLPPVAGGLARMHLCRGLLGLLAPMVPDGTRCKIEIRERDDYVGSDIVEMRDGRAIMSTVVTREDGQDCVVYAPCVTRASVSG